MSVGIQKKQGWLSPGTILDNRFEIVEHLGSGGFGSVYRAKQVVFGHKLREVALKLFKSETVSQDNFIDIFNDVIILIGLQEEKPSFEVTRHLIKIYDIGVIQSSPPQAYMCMQLVPGRKTLGSAIRRFKYAGGMPVGTSLMFLRQILVPLAWMHTLENPVVHGDLKPENILLKDESELVLTDFGMAVRLPLGALGGTIQYQAPESLANVPSKTESDIYAVGIMWYEMLTGHHPFEDVGLEAFASNYQEAYVQAHLQARKREIRPACGDTRQDENRIPPASEFNHELKAHPQLEAILNRCLSYWASKRYPNARLLLNDIDKYIESGCIQDIDIVISAQNHKGDIPSQSIDREKTLSMLVQDAKCLLASGQFEQACKITENALRKDSKFVPALLIKAQALAAMGQIENAKKVCNQARKLDPDEPDVFGALAEVYKSAGKIGMYQSLRQQERSLREKKKRIGYRRY